MKKFLAALILLSITLTSAFAMTSCMGGEGDGNGDSGNSNGGGTGANSEVTYTVTVLDGTVGVAGVNLMFENKDLTTGTKGKFKTATTNAEGKASITVAPANWKVRIESVPSGYNVDKTIEYSFTDGAATISIGSSQSLVAYTVYVKDASGAPVSGIQVQICKGELCLQPKTTDSEGKVVYNQKEDEWKAQITGNTSNPKYEFDANNTVIIIIEE